MDEPLSLMIFPMNKFFCVNLYIFIVLISFDLATYVIIYIL